MIFLNHNGVISGTRFVGKVIPCSFHAKLITDYQLIYWYKKPAIGHPDLIEYKNGVVTR